MSNRRWYGRGASDRFYIYKGDRLKKHADSSFCINNLAGPYRDCFSDDTLVLTPEGYKQITSIKSGDLVMAFDEALGAFVERKVIANFAYSYKRIKPVYMYRMGNKLEETVPVYTTPNHAFAVKPDDTDTIEWKNADKLDYRDWPVAFKHEAQKWERNWSINMDGDAAPRVELVFNLVVEGGNYLVAGNEGDPAMVVSSYIDPASRGGKRLRYLAETFPKIAASLGKRSYRRHALAA